jgi:ribonuclease HII
MPKTVRNIQTIIGIDEAGRGALAGPVAVGAALVPKGFDWGLLPGVGDSKKMSPKRREDVYSRAKQLEKRGDLQTAVALISAQIIDTHGITYAVQKGIDRVLASLGADPTFTQVKLDGLLHAPEVYRHQETIVRGDTTEKEIGLASIMAKVTRDKYMVALEKRHPHPHYGFGLHKGYGTIVHRMNIKKRGLSTIHRTTFCRSCQ